jgi:hypothetical protein
MRRRLVLATLAVGMAAAGAVPAMAKPASVGSVRGPSAQAPHSSRLMCARLPQQTVEDAEQRACLLIFGP